MKVICKSAGSREIAKFSFNHSSIHPFISLFSSLDHKSTRKSERFLQKHILKLLQLMLLPALSGAWKGLKDLKDFHTLMIWTRQRPSSHY